MNNDAKDQLKKISSELEVFNKEKQVEICLNLAKLILPYWENYYDDYEDDLDIFRKTSVRSAIEISKKWLKTKDKEILVKAESISNEVWEDMQKVSLFYDETSGNTGTIKNREKALMSIECAYQTIQCVLWTKEKVKEEYLNKSIDDEKELKARQENGAVFETAQAINSARLVIEDDEIVLKEIMKAIH